MMLLFIKVYLLIGQLENLNIRVGRKALDINNDLNIKRYQVIGIAIVLF